MPAISTDAIVNAARRVNASSLHEKTALLDQIHASQPHVLLTALALSLDGVDLAMLDHLLHVLMVVHLTTQEQMACNPKVISPDDIRLARAKHDSMLSYLESEPDDAMWQLTVTTYPETALLAYLVGYLRDHGLTAKSDADCQVLTMAKVALDVYVNAIE